ncbi:MAG: glycosyltransferase family 2 protein [Cyanothece sp. SIO1E1]|nr:glycosyltransferase family 2 protein [Cyanothece sp. SIO1E1]
MALLLDIVTLAIALGLLVPVAVLFLECSAALLPSPPESQPIKELHPRVTVLVPAHNEASGIAATLETILPQLEEPARLVVVADNCTDATAAIARQAGAIVIEREDREHPGKGYALDYGLQSMAPEPPEVVIVIDADCQVENGAIEQLAQAAMQLKRPIQATYLMERPNHPGPKDSVSALAFMVKNLVRLIGLKRLGLPCLITGTGTAFPWSVISQISLASGNIVEDMQLSVDLAIAGHAPIFWPAARVTGRLPQQDEAATSQRTRWEHGHLQTLLTQVPILLKSSLQQRRFDLLALALDLCIPPLSLLVMLWAAAMGLALLVTTVGAPWTASRVLGLEGLMILSSIVGAWAKFGRQDLPVLTLLAIPFYVLWKIPLYLAFLIRPQTQWVRTERDVIDT